MKNRYFDPRIQWRGMDIEIPPDVHSILVGYIQDGVHIWSDFLYGVVVNNLKEAVLRSDNVNLPMIPHIVGWLYNYAPAPCHGSPEKVEAWIKSGGLRGQGFLDAKS